MDADDPLAETSVVFLVKGRRENSIPYFVYVSVPARRVPDFLEASKQQGFAPADFGVIFAAGDGEPDAVTCRQMEKHYGFRHDAMVNFSSITGDAT